MIKIKRNCDDNNLRNIDLNDLFWIIIGIFTGIVGIVFGIKFFMDGLFFGYSIILIVTGIISICREFKKLKIVKVEGN